MCGIAGIISPNQEHINPVVLKKMSDILSHRGPDGDGIWINPKKTAGLAHRRLAILDLTDAAAQPLHFKDRYSIVYNGEIYNYIEIKEQLSSIFEGKKFTIKLEKELNNLTTDFTPEKKEFYKTLIKKMYIKWKPLIEEAIKEAEQESKK